jgi:phenylalanine-4-hydroxylase
VDFTLVKLDRDHPGFRDPAYRTRRDAIALVARRHVSGQPVPEVEYVAEEHEVWRLIGRRLAPLHRARVCAELNEVQEQLGLDQRRIPQLASLNPTLHAATGFRMEPVAGLVSPRIFLEKLAERVFLSTQYIRHHSRPLYTPEPDVVHELVGHAASLLHPGLAALSERFGRAALAADEGQLRQLINLYWYTLEFGACEESGEVKAYGAGLLSSAGELERFSREAELRPWDVDRIADTTFDPTDYQPQVYVAPSFGQMLEDLSGWLDDVVLSAA